jgi:hypothetical protein
LSVHWMFPECSLNVPWVFTECSLRPWGTHFSHLPSAVTSTIDHPLGPLSHLYYHIKEVVSQRKEPVSSLSLITRAFVLCT